MIDAPQRASRDLAPVAVYTYSRVDHFIRTVESLKRNHLAAQTTLYIVSDGPKCDDHKPLVQAIRNYTENLDGFREVVKIFRPSNLGMAVSPPDAEKAILADHGSIINMEDDNIASTNYLDFMNAGLQHFEYDESVYSVCGYCPPIPDLNLVDDRDFWFYPWNLSWGYGLWKHKHDRFYQMGNRYPAQLRAGQLLKQSRAGGLYVTDSLRRDYKNQKYFPDAILGTEMFLAGMRAVVPVRSKLHNIGQDGSGQSSQRKSTMYDVQIDATGQRSFNFKTESTKAEVYRQAVIALYNGGTLTRIARQMGLYHELSDLRTRWMRMIGST